MSPSLDNYKERAERHALLYVTPLYEAEREARFVLESLAGGVSATEIMAFDQNLTSELVSLYQMAEEALGDREAAITWLRQPRCTLGNQMIYKVIRQKGGLERVQTILGQIQYGVYA